VIILAHRTEHPQPEHAMRIRDRSLMMLLLLTGLGGCMGWRTSTVEPANLIAQDHPGAVRVTRRDGSRVIMFKPVVEGDSLRGRQGRHTMALPLSDVADVSVQKTKVGATAFLVVLTAATVAAVIAIGTWDGPLGGGFQ
jgi:hypothetical protein